MSFPKELLVSGNRLKPISEEDEEKDLELQTVIPSALESISELKSTSPFIVSIPGQPKDQKPEVNRKFVIIPADRQKLLQSHPTNKAGPPLLKDPIQIQRTSNPISLKPNDFPKGIKSPQAKEALLKDTELRKEKSKELGTGDVKCQWIRKPNRVLKEYTEATKLKNGKAQTVIIKDYNEMLYKFPAYYKLLHHTA